MGAQAINCQDNGGVAAILYQSIAGPLVGTLLSSNTAVLIPVALLLPNDGNTLASNSLDQSVTLHLVDGYMFSEGTSMSTPHAAGAAAALWRACRNCTYIDIQTCLYTTALDLGEQGRDPVYGYGLVQMDSAYNCLKQICC